MSVTKFKFAAKAALFSFSLLQTMITPGCSSTKELNSEPFTGTSYRMVGRSEEWKGKKMLDLKDDGLMVGIQNDANNVYLCLMSDEKATERRMAAAGMIVWFEPEHGKKFGIHYPLPRVKMPATEQLYGYHTDMEILGPGKDDIAQSSILTSEADYGMTAAFRDSAGVAVLELKIPRSVKWDPYTTGLDTLVDMTIESGKLDQSSKAVHQGAMAGGGRRRHNNVQNSGTSSESESQTSDDPDGGRGNAGEHFDGEKSSSNPILVNLRVHLLK
ncbi:MAG TPA: hypothetical protein VMU30_04190 [Bacteroidota bacterium]|nr:hypothetical protein [Bacteroidota bacterium]